MLPQRQIHFLLSLLVSVKCSLQLRAKKSVNAFPHHEDRLPLSVQLWHLDVLFLLARALIRWVNALNIGSQFIKIFLDFFFPQKNLCDLFGIIISGKINGRSDLS